MSERSIDPSSRYYKATTGPQTLLDIQPWPSLLARSMRPEKRLLRLRAGLTGKGKGRVTTKHPD